MEYVLLYTFMFLYESVEQHYQATAPATEISLVVPSEYQPQQVTLNN
jgi:hypothetical protein